MQTLDFNEWEKSVLNKEDIIDFFNKEALHWDEHMIRDDEVIDKILDNAGVTKGTDVLDVACGTGVLIPDYLKRKVNSITAIDISPEMIKIARKKFQEEDSVNFVCGDVEKACFDKKFDCIVVYNAFPHFFGQEKLIEILSDLLKEGGVLTIAHGMSREQINRHHEGRAKYVSLGLISEKELAAMFERVLHVETVISDDSMYQVVGKKL